MMLKVLITDEIKDWARQKTARHKKASMFNEEVNLHDSVFLGYLAEAAFRHCFPEAEHHDRSGYDFLLHGAKVELKGWWTKYEPSFFRSYVQVPERDSTRSVGRYVFACVKADHSTVWLVGWINVSRFKSLAERRKKGDTARGMRYTVNCFELPVWSLETFDIPPYLPVRPRARESDELRMDGLAPGNGA